MLDANGAPVPRATVRLPVLGGFTFVFANDSGVFRFPDLTLGEYLIQAPGPSRESLISFMEANGYRPAQRVHRRATSPPISGTSRTPTFGDRNAMLAAYQDAVRTFLNVDESLLVGLPMADLGRVRLEQGPAVPGLDDGGRRRQVPAAGNRVRAAPLDGDGRPIAALTRITGLAVSQTGLPTVAELGRVTTPMPATGTFSFSGIPRFDLATFQTAGVRGG